MRHCPELASKISAFGKPHPLCGVSTLFSILRKRDTCAKVYLTVNYKELRLVSATCVIGLQWGDEAKGKIVDWLTQDHDVIVRYNGGSNAGHTVVKEQNQ